MLTEGVLVAAVAAVASIIVAGLNAYDRVERKKRQAEREEIDRRMAARAEQNDKLRILMMTQQMATAKGVRVLLRKAHGDHINGECDDALRRIEEADAALTKQKDTIIVGGV